MNIEKELAELEAKGAFINWNSEHYGNGTNMSFQIEIILDRNLLTDREKYSDATFKTGWYNDNHEYGDVVPSLIAAIKIANAYLENDYCKLCVIHGPIKWNKDPELRRIYEIFEDRMNEINKEYRND